MCLNIEVGKQKQRIIKNKNKNKKKHMKKKKIHDFFWKSAGKVAGGGRSWAASGGGRRLAAAAGGWRWLLDPNHWA
jgi:hypothetical protein